jgi:hypothetical protein
MPVNGIIVRALMMYFMYYGEGCTIECSTGSGRMMNLYQVAEELARRLTNIFLRDKGGRRPVYGETARFQQDPHWRDYLLFYEYFHKDNGAGSSARAVRLDGRGLSLELYTSLRPQHQNKLCNSEKKRE